MANEGAYSCSTRKKITIPLDKKQGANSTKKGEAGGNSSGQ